MKPARPALGRLLVVALLSLAFLGATPSPGAQALSASDDSPPTRWIVGVSPFLDDESKNAVYRHLVRWMVEDLPREASVVVMDAYHLQTVVRLHIPTARAFASSRTRINQFQDEFRQLRQFLATHHPQATNAPFALNDAVRLPQFLAFVAENLRAAGEEPNVIVLGSPLYLDDREPTFSMADGVFPSDGHLLVGADQSVFGIKDRGDYLRGITLHLGYFHDPFLTGIQKERIGRFWSLWTSLQGGRLATLSGDVATVFANLRRSAPESTGMATHAAVDPTQTKVEMIRATREVSTTDWITGELTNAAQTPPTSLVGPLKLGIRWQGSIDLDLYARPASDSETLYFEHPRSAAGYYYKDHRTSPDREYEFIEFTEPVDIRQLEASINFYEGRAPGGPAGEIRIEFAGRIYSGRFTIESERGNRGRGGDGQASWWHRINLREVLRLGGTG